jgi:hypothetical protein
VTTERLVPHPLTPAEAQRIVDRDPGPEDRWHGPSASPSHHSGAHDTMRREDGPESHGR